MSVRVTREEAIEEAGRVLAAGRAAQSLLSVEDAARAAYTPTGPPLEELVARIRAQRAAAAAAAGGAEVA